MLGWADLLRCLRLNLNSRNKGSGNTSRRTSVATLMAADMIMKRYTSMHPPSLMCMMSQMRETGTHRKSWALEVRVSLGSKAGGKRAVGIYHE